MALKNPDNWHIVSPGFKVEAELREIKRSMRDNGLFQTHTKPMTEAISRSDLNETLSAIEERMDKRVERIEQSEAVRADAYRREADAYRREQEARDRLYAERFEATSKRLEDRDKVIDSKLDAMNGAVLRMTDKVDGFSGYLDQKVSEVKASNKNTVFMILGIVVSVGAATVLGLWGANSTIVGSASSIFQSGQQNAESDQVLRELLQEAKSQSAETRALLDSLKPRETQNPSQ